MKLKLILTTAIVGVALALPSVSSAAPPAPPPAQDSVSLIGGPASTTGWTLLTIDATSGPSGENPTGEVLLRLGGINLVGGPVTCLAVSGNTAVINFTDQQLVLGFNITVLVSDNLPDTFFAAPLGRVPTDCSPVAEQGAPVSGGDITVVDAQPSPTSKEQCKNGGWRSFPQFKNQGQCIAFVNHGP